MADYVNKITIFGKDCKVGSGLNNAVTPLNFANDSTTGELDGLIKGMASSKVLNTTLRQSSFMAYVLAQAIQNRFNPEGSAGNVVGPIDWLNQDTFDITQNAKALAHLFDPSYNNNTFLQAEEVQRNHINSNIIADSPGATTNGISFSLSYSAQDGLKLSASVNTDNLKVKINTADTNGTYYIVASNNVKNPGDTDYTDKETLYRLSGISLTKQGNNTSVGIANGDLQVLNGTIYGQIGSNSSDLRDAVYCTTLNTTSDITVPQNSKVEAGSFNAISDRRLKEDINYAKFDALSIIKNIDLNTFRYKNDDKLHLGIIAQDIENVDINGVRFVDKDKNGYLSIRTNEIIFLLWQAIAQLNDKINK